MSTIVAAMSRKITGSRTVSAAAACIWDGGMMSSGTRTSVSNRLVPWQKVFGCSPKLSPWSETTISQVCSRMPRLVERVDQFTDLFVEIGNAVVIGIGSESNARG